MLPFAGTITGPWPAFLPPREAAAKAERAAERMSAAAQDFRDRAPWAWEAIHHAEFGGG